VDRFLPENDKLMSPMQIVGRGYAAVRIHDKIVNGAGSIKET